MGKIKLNHKCGYCKKDIYIGEGTIICGEPRHFNCYKKEAIAELKKYFVEFLKECVKNTNSVRKKLKQKIEELEK